MSDEVEIGRGKRGRRAYTLDDIALVPSRRTRDPEDVNVGWQIDAYHVDIPVMAAPMDSVMSPETAIAFGRLGGIGVLDLDGLWTRYEDPTPILERISHLGEEESIASLQRIYSEPIKPSLITARLKQLREAGVVVAGKLSPQRVQQHWRAVVDAGVIYELDVPVIVGGVCTDTAALHLMRTGAAGVLVGFGGGAAHSTRQSLGVHAPMATAIADVAAARRDYMDESGGRYVHVIADGGIGRSGDLSRAIACGADAVMLGAAIARAEEAPGRGWHWGSEATHPDMPRGQRVHVGTTGTLEQILYGPSTRADGSLNFIGALKRTMASMGYSEVKDLQRAQVVVSPYSAS